MTLYTLYKIFNEPAYYDLSNGSLSDDPVRTYRLTDSCMFPIYSAEALLNEIGSEGTVTIYKKELPEENIVWRDEQ